MRHLSTAAQLWITSVLALGGVVLAVALARLIEAPGVLGIDAPGVWVLLIAAAIAHAFPVVAPRHQAYHATQAFLMASVLILSGPAIVLVILAAHTVEWLRRRRPWFIQLYNVAVYLVSAALAGASLTVLNGLPFTFGDPLHLAAAVIAAAVFLLSNHGLTAIVLRLARGVPLAQSGLFGRESLGIDGALLLVGIGIAGAWTVQPLAAVLAAAPLALIYRALRMTNVDVVSHRDGVTGLYNARHFEEALDLELRRALPAAQRTGVIVVTLDDLPLLVQRYGRATLDFLLVALAERVSHELRSYDVVARLGEGTLGILVPGADARQMTQMARNVLDVTAATGFGVPTTREPVAATASAALACIVGEAVAADAMADLERAAERARLIGPRSLVVVESEPRATVQPGSPAAPEPTPLGEPVPPAVDATGWSLPARSLPVFEVLVIGAALALTVVAGLRYELPDLSLIVGVIALSLGSELLAFELYDHSSFSISFVPILAAGLIGGPTALLLATWSVAVLRGSLRRSRLDKVLFNGAVFSLAGLGALWIATAGGVLPIRASELTSLVVATLVGSAAYYLHTFPIAFAVGLDLRTDPRLVWSRNFRWLFPHYPVLGLMGLGLAVATVELGPLGSALFLAPPLMMRVVLKQYTDRVAGAVARLETANAELVSSSQLLRRQGDELALLSDLGQIAASEPRTANLPALIVGRCVPALGDACAVVWRGSDGLERAVHAREAASALASMLSVQKPEELLGVAARVYHDQPLDPPQQAVDGVWSAAPLPGADQQLGWLLAWSAEASAEDTDRAERRELMGEVARRVALVLERDVLLEEAASVDAVRAVDRAKSDFIGTMAHELRTPLTSLQGFTELLGAEVEPGLRDRWLRIVQVEAAQLGQVLDQLLDVSRLDTDRFRAERRAFDLAEVIERVVEAFRQQGALTNHHFECSLAAGVPACFADPTHVERVLRNLVSNALKYAPNGGPVRIIVATRTPAEIEVSVEDEGLGVPAEWQARLFERFQRVDVPERASIRGTGLGLYITRQLVELNGGRVWVTSAGAGRGAAFHFTLSAAPPGR
jgi:diguanylate cyclase (GGDEF)-like protein